MTRACRPSLVASFTILCASSPAGAGSADVLAASVRCSPDRSCSFEVTVKHADEGFDHYADRWDVVAPDGKVIATRVLRHPHVGEQPFTRSLSGVRVPEIITKVTIRAHDSVHGLGGVALSVELPPS